MNSHATDKFIGRKCILYSTEADGYYSYNMCDNRIVFEKPSKAKYYEEDYKKKLPEFEAMYKKEKQPLDSLLKVN